MRTATREVRRRAAEGIRLQIRCVDGPIAGRIVEGRPPLQREFRYGATRYDVIRQGARLFAFEQRAPNLSLPQLAWRCWNVDREILARPLLRSLNDGYIWPTAMPLAAKCDVIAEIDAEADHLADPTSALAIATAGSPRKVRELPHAREELVVENCSCGIWSTKTFENLLAAAHGEIYGLVALWGAVQPHELGYRGAYAFPIALVFNPEIALADGFAPADWLEESVRFTRAIGRIYRVPTVACTPQRTVPAIARMARDGLLQPWASRVLPRDVELALATERTAGGGRS